MSEREALQALVNLKRIKNKMESSTATLEEASLYLMTKDKAWADAEDALDVADPRNYQHEVIQAAYRPGPMCRDCADYDGVCPTDGKKCSPFEAALDILRTYDKQPTPEPEDIPYRIRTYAVERGGNILGIHSGREEAVRRASARIGDLWYPLFKKG